MNPDDAPHFETCAVDLCDIHRIMVKEVSEYATWRVDQALIKTRDRYTCRLPRRK